MSFWIFFNIFVVVMLVLDLGIFHRKAHVVKVKEALVWTSVWIGLAFLFCLGIYLFMGHEQALKFLTGYLIEESLSVDNLFVFLLIFSYFRVPAVYQHKVLFWGILGAIVLRAAFILAGITFIQRFHWAIYVFGGFLVVTGIKMLFEKEEDEIRIERNIIIKIFRRLVPITDHFMEGSFFVRHNGILHATPLFVVLLVVEMSDVIFAADSIPAILSITTDPFIVYTSNIFAIMGLRSLYFALAGLMRLFRYLNYGLSVILTFVGAKMLASDFFEIPVLMALCVIIVVLAVSIVFSIIFPSKNEGGA